MEVAADENGKIQSVRVHIDADMGAYMMLITPGVPLLGSFLYTGVYDIPNLAFTCDGYFTNLTPTDAYRGAGRPEASYAIERIMDLLAGEVGITPQEIRERNYINGGEAFENHEAASTLVFDSGHYRPAHDRLLKSPRSTSCELNRPDDVTPARQNSSVWACVPMSRSAAWRLHVRSAASTTALAVGNMQQFACFRPARSKLCLVRPRMDRATRRHGR